MTEDILYSKIGSTLSWTDILVDLIENRIPNFPLDREDKDILIEKIRRGNIQEVALSIADGFVYCNIFRESDPADYRLYVSWQHDEFLESYTFLRDGTVDFHIESLYP